ncbi:MAG: YetF domain-containing protein [Bdellovibrionota bacterium]
METVLRVLIIYAFITIVLRILGKRELSELSPYELVMVMLVPELATQGLNRNDYSITNSIIGISTLLSLVFLNSVLTYRFKKISEAIEGAPSILFHDGKFFEDTMHRERVSADEIISEMHSAGIETLGELKWVILEPDGKLSCIRKENQNSTRLENIGA